MTSPAGSRYRLNVAALHQALDVVRHHRRLSWQQLAAETGLAPSLFSRLAGGHKPDADGLVTLLVWLGHADTIRAYITTGDPINGRPMGPIDDPETDDVQS